MINLGPNELLSAEVGFLAGQDLELALYAPGATRGEDAPIRTSRGTNPREFISYSPRNAGDYLLRVYGVTQSVITPYDLHIDRTPPFICMADIPDNEGRGQDMATAIDLGVAPTRMDDLTICQDDLGDWFRVALTAPAVNVIRIQYPGAVYHVTCRGNDRQDIFRDDEDRKRFLMRYFKRAD